MTVRKWTTDLQQAQPTDDYLKDFMQFLDKYVSHAVGNHHFMQWSKSNRTKTFLDKVTASDIAYTILVYENSKEVWKEKLQIRATSRTDDERRTATRVKKPRYHEGRGKRLKRYGDGKIIGKCIRRNTTTKGMMFKMMKEGSVTKNATKVMKKIGGLMPRITLSVMKLMTH